MGKIVSSLIAVDDELLVLPQVVEDRSPEITRFFRLIPKFGANPTILEIVCIQYVTR